MGNLQVNTVPVRMKILPGNRERTPRLSLAEEQGHGKRSIREHLGSDWESGVCSGGQQSTPSLGRFDLPEVRGRSLHT